MKKFLNLIILFLSLSFATKAQFNETIRTGRPGQAIGPFTPGKGIFQNQTGVDVNGIESSNNSFDATGLNTVLRYGVIENFEVSGLFNYNINDFGSFFNQAQLGMRTHIYEGKGLVPSIGIQYRMKFPIQESKFISPNEYITSKLTFIAGQRFSKNLTLNTNLGVDWISEKLPPEGFYVFSFGYALSDKWGTVAEIYGTQGLYDSFNVFNVDGGISYLVNNDLQFDLYGGYGGFETSINTYFISVGVSWRTKRK